MYLLGRSVAPALAGLQGKTWREAWEENITPRTPMGRSQTVEDMGKAIVFMVSDDAKEITGQSLFVDGGTDNLLSTNWFFPLSAPIPPDLQRAGGSLRILAVMAFEVDYTELATIRLSVRKPLG